MCNYFVVKLHEATQMPVMVDLLREMTPKKSLKHGSCGSSEHLLFLFWVELCVGVGRGS